MTIKYNVAGAKRKELVQLISRFTGCEIKYKGAPTFAYEVDYFTIDKNGAVSFDDRADSEVIERLTEMLYDNGFEAEALPETTEQHESENTNVDIPQNTEFDITVPFEKVSVGNLTRLLEVKGNLIKKALGIDDLSIAINDDSISFPWFENSAYSPTDMKAYTEFVSFLCEMTKKQKRITATEKRYDNEKYAFRCFLLRLGFIGKEYKESRKILLRNLEGSSAFKSGSRTETEVETNA